MKRKSDKSDVGVIVGRFQVPFLHEGHIELIQSVCNEHSKVIIYLGLSPCLGSRNNPLDFESRKQMILHVFPQVTAFYIKDVPSDGIWSKNLDSQIADILGPNQTVTLYGGRDSFIQRYTGKYQTQELLLERFISGTEIRREISNTVKSSPDFRAGVIWASYNQYPRCFPTIDVAIFNEDYSKVLLARKPNEKQYRFIGGFASPDSDSYESDVRREVAEETHLEIGDIKYVGSALIDDWRYRGETDKIKTMLFTAKHTYGRPEADDDIAEVRWFDCLTLHHFSSIERNDIVEEHKPLLALLLEKRFMWQTPNHVLYIPSGNTGYDKSVQNPPYVVPKPNTRAEV